MNLTKNLAVEWAPYNITVNAIGPAVFETELTVDSIELPGFMDLIKAYCPAGRLGKPGELDGIPWRSDPGTDPIKHLYRRAGPLGTLARQSLHRR